MIPKCVTCGRPVDRDKRFAVNTAGEKLRCPRCFFRRVALRHTGSKANWLALRNVMLRQGCRCVYTGRLLILGSNASLDHRQPKSRGGTGRTENLQWVTAAVNDMKCAMTHKEFLALCREVTECSGQPRVNCL